ncbi:hypothetical protein E5D57_011944 [Metarhizium anisopliae]|nr:hypothetical protein E5D57_011944 [Metarhizium anisopliae]
MAHVDSETRAADSRNDAATRPSSVLNSPSTRTGRAVDANPRDVKAQLMPSVHFARGVYPDMVMLCAARRHGMPEVFGRKYTWGEAKRFKEKKDVCRSPIGQCNLIEAMPTTSHLKPQRRPPPRPRARILPPAGPQLGPPQPRPRHVPGQGGHDVVLQDGHVVDGVEQVDARGDVVGQRRGEDALDVAVGREAGEAPAEQEAGRAPAVALVLGGPQAAALKYTNGHEERPVEHAYDGDVDGVEDARRDEELERQHGQHGQHVEGRRVGEQRVALDALKGEDGAAEANLGGLVGDNVRKGVCQDGHEDGQEERVAEEGKGDHERGAEHNVEAHRLGDARAVEAEPDPEQPFADGWPRRRRRCRRRLVRLAGVVEPQQREEEAQEAPHGQKGQQRKVPHHGVERDEDNVVRHDVEGDAREQDGRRHAENVQAVAVGQAAGQDVVGAAQHVGGVDGDKGDVEEGPEALRVQLPAVLDDGRKLLQHPARRVDGKGELPLARGGLLVRHGHDVQQDEHHELHHFDEGADPGHDEAPVVEDARLPRVVELDRTVLVVVGEDVHEGQRRVDDLAHVDGLDQPLAGGRADEGLALGENGQLERRELPLVAAAPLDGPLEVAALALDLVRRAVKGIKPLDEDLGEEQEALVSGVVLVEASNDTGRHELAEGGAGSVDALCGESGLRLEEEDAVGEEAVHWKEGDTQFSFSFGLRGGRLLPMDIFCVS